MAVDAGLRDQVKELFGGLGAIRCRPMFGALGVYADDLFFAVADDGIVWIKADDVTEPAFKAEGSQPFTFTSKDGRMEVMRYWRLPDIAYDDPEEALRWGRLGVEAALRAQTAKAPRAKRT